MSENNISIFLGEQLRHYRKQKGLTQEQLAEMVNTTAQTISNYERFGIKDTDVEVELSRALGKNLREKSADKEGTVGEVGKEILYILLEQGGQISFVGLSNCLFGMSEKRIINEIDKVADLDMCTREKFMGFDGEERDIVYITAKGIITCKNMISDEYHLSKLNDLLPDVESYEELLRPSRKYEKDLETAIDMEDYVSKRPWISEILKLKLDSSYKADYVSYIFQHGAVTDSLPKPKINNGINPKWFFPGVNFYHDLIYRMAYGFDEKWRRDFYFKLFDQDWVERNDEVFFLVNGDMEDEDNVVSLSISKFKKEFSWVSEDGIRGTMHPFSKVSDTQQKKELLEEFDAFEDFSIEVNSFGTEESERKNRYKECAPKGLENAYPDKWFSKEQIERFIRENYHAPRSEEEMQIQKQIEVIEKLRPSMKAYYSFPKEWEENGLADLVRELCVI